MAYKGEKGEDGDTKIWISREWKKLFRWNNLVKNENLIKNSGHKL